MQEKSQPTKEEKGSSLSLDQKKKICVTNIQAVMTALLKEYPEQFKKNPKDYFKVAVSERPKKASSLVMGKDENAGVGFLSVMQPTGDACKVIQKLFEGFTNVRPALVTRDFREIAYFCKNTDAEVDLLLKKSEQLKNLYGPFDIKLLRSLASPVPASTGGLGFYDRKPKSSALEDENISSLVAKLFTGKSMHSVKIEADLISFRGKREDAEEVFMKAMESLKESGLSADGIMSNLKIKYEPTIEVTLDIEKVAAELNKPKEEAGLDSIGT
ncbi:Uncharacterised protein [Legionella steigerwaltii]|uniref:Uncharacterized protein n=1 Tax=Legionella steigerwaltii TaxID=460 RepID=A0A378LAF2_9GAMM|nr:hypothetical protein [Legionella steigerwaltii]KTD70291.1 hypothetical protein Lstg_3293 [Legionella steigerwaltii]STY24025.1 Uncharacterised protein [Legionella steigerwaltii]